MSAMNGSGSLLMVKKTMSSKMMFDFSDKRMNVLTKESVIRMHKKWNVLRLKGAISKMEFLNWM